jgi:hypothetical protein
METLLPIQANLFSLPTAKMETKKFMTVSIYFTLSLSLSIYIYIWRPALAAFLGYLWSLVGCDGTGAAVVHICSPRGN